jgi:uncharacterized protein YdaU (DUF1376 family)
MARLPWYKRYPRDFREGTRKLTFEERGFYNDVLDLIYENGDELVDDDASNAHKVECDIRTWKRLKARLVEASKLSVVEGFLRNGRASAETSATNARVAQATMAGELSGQSRRKSAQVSKPCNDLDGTPVPTPVPTKNEQTTDSQNQKEKEKKGAHAPAAPYAFEGRVIRLAARDYDSWKAMAPHVPVEAKLRARDAWYAEEVPAEERRRWFITTSAWLANLEQAELRKLETERERVAECGRVTDYRLDPKRWHLPG